MSRNEIDEQALFETVTSAIGIWKNQPSSHSNHQSFSRYLTEQIITFLTAVKCNKCKDTGWYQYTGFTRGTPHSKVCEYCCKHDQGYWLLLEHYGEDNNKWCCLAGCGHTITEEEYRNLHDKENNR